MAEASAPRPLTVRVRRVALRTAVGLGTGAVLIVVFLRLVNIGAVARHLAHLNVGLALLCGVAFLGAFVVRALRWRCLLTPTCRVSIRRAVAIYQVAIFINWLLPVRGGELVKCLLLRRSDGVPISRSLNPDWPELAMRLRGKIIQIDTHKYPYLLRAIGTAAISCRADLRPVGTSGLCPSSRDGPREHLSGE